MARRIKELRAEQRGKEGDEPKYGEFFSRLQNANFNWIGVVRAAQLHHCHYLIGPESVSIMVRAFKEI